VTSPSFAVGAAVGALVAFSAGMLHDYLMWNKKYNTVHQKKAEKSCGPHRVVDDATWLKARKRLLRSEKCLTQQTDMVVQERQAMPWRRVSKDYVFVSTNQTNVALSSLLSAKQPNLIVYHFMYDPASPLAGRSREPCAGCAGIVDGIDGGTAAHLSSGGKKCGLVVVAKAGPKDLAALARKKGWSVPLLSSSNNTFNVDFGVEATAEQLAANDFAFFNYGSGRGDHHSSQFPGMSVFHRGDDGTIYHTYSTYARGVDHMMAVTQMMDLLPFGRDGWWFQHKEDY